jgi:hypothetical protein
MAGFLNANEGRAYPLQDVTPRTLTGGSGAVSLPDDAIVDFRCIVGLDATWGEDTDSVYLHSIAREFDGTLVFDFRATAYGLQGLALRFTRSPTALEFAVETVDAVEVVDGSSYGGIGPGTCGDALLWTGTLVTGRLAALQALVPVNTSVTAADAALPLEPALVQNLARTYVRSVNLANINRVHAAAPAGCPTIPSSLYPIGAAIVTVTCISGDVIFRAGYNCDITQTAATNALTIGAGVGSGLGEPCNEVPLYPGEAPPAGSTLLSGGPACTEVITSVNGIVAANLQLVAGDGMQITTSATAPHTLVVGVAPGTLAACPPYIESSH